MYLGIDLGTSGVKAVAVDAEHRIVAQAASPLTVQRPHALWSEQDPQAWWTAVSAAVRALPAQVRGAVRGVGLSGQMHGAVLLDAADRPLRPAILWNDGRSAAQCEDLERLVPFSREITGNLAMPGFTAPKLLWVRAHEPAIFAAVRSVLLPKDYLRLLLTGDKYSDMSDASGTLWLDVGARRWSGEMLQATALTEQHMPRLVEGSAAAGSVLPEVAEALGIPCVPVAGGGGDNAASAVGLGLVRPGEAFLSLGTSGVLFVVTDRFRPNPVRAAHAFCHAVPDRWHQMSVMLSASSALDWATAITGQGDLVSAVTAAEQRGIGADTPIFLPYLSGERTPHNDAYARGVYLRLGNDTTSADLVAGTMEGVAHAFAQGLDALTEAGSTIGDISVVGGGSRIDWWLTLLASALDRPLIKRKGGEIGAALGAARLGRLAVEGGSVDQLCTVPPVDRIVAPDPELRARLQQRRPIFDDSYRRLRPVFREFPA